MTIFHGIKVSEPITGARAITTVASAVIGLVATATDADAQVFPLNTPVVISDVRSAIGSAGVVGTLAKALGAIADQCSPTIVVVRVAVGVAAQGVTVDQATDINVIGASAGGVYTGMKALLAAEAVTGVRPRILGCPGLDSQAVLTALIPIAQQLRGFIYGKGVGAAVADVLTYRDEFGARELMLIWPDLTGWSGQAVATAMGLRALLDETQGFAKSVSNVVFNGASGISKHVFWDLQDGSTDAGLLNAACITTLIRKDGYRFWGNRTCDDDSSPFTFEVATRTAQILQDTMAGGLMPFVDRPLTVALIRDIIETINGELRLLKSQDQIIDGKCWYDPSSNAPLQLSAGNLVLDYDYTPCAPLEDLGLNQRITDQYYATFGDQLAAG